MSTLKSLIKLGLIQASSTRTLRYVVEKNDFDAVLDNLVFTIETVRANIRNNRTLMINGDLYRPTEYEFFGNITELVKCGCVWSATVSAEYMEPYFEATTPEPANGKVKLLTPAQVKAIIKRLNENQDSESKYSVTKVSDDVVGLLQFKGWAGETPDTIVMNETGFGSIDEKVAVINNIKTPFVAGTAVELDVYSDEVMSEWLVSNS